MYRKFLNEKSIKKRSRIRTTVLDGFLIDFLLIFGPQIVSKSMKIEAAEVPEEASLVDGSRDPKINQNAMRGARN